MAELEPKLVIRAIKRLMQSHQYYSGTIDDNWDHNTSLAWQAYCKSIAYARVTPFPEVHGQPDNFRKLLLDRYEKEKLLVAGEVKKVITAPIPVPPPVVVPKVVEEVKPAPAVASVPAAEPTPAVEAPTEEPTPAAEELPVTTATTDSTDVKTSLPSSRYAKNK